MLRPRTKTATGLILSLSAIVIAVLLGASAGQTVVTTFTPDDGRDIANPERGLYLQFTSQAEEGPLTPDMFTQLHEQNMTMILRMYYFKTFRDRPLSEAELNMIENDFAVIRDAGVKCVLRFAYTQAIGEPDAPIDVVLGHMEQLSPILNANADVIATAQAGFVGAWGEWHASTNDLAEPHNAKQIVHKWLDILPDTRTVQLRTPRQKWMILEDKTPITESQAFNKSPIARIGHHNDCFISSETDVGTYEDIENEKRYLSQETRFLPMGGETCALTKFSDPDNARAEMENLHFSYLNLGYHPEVLEKWRTDGFFKEVKNRLGYRLSLVSMTHPESAKAGGSLPITLTINNSGFAAPYNPRDVKLILKNADGSQAIVLPLQTDPRNWLPGETTVNQTLQLPDSLSPGKYSLSLALPDPEPGLSDNPAYAIQLANPGMWNSETGANELGVTVVVGD